MGAGKHTEGPWRVCGGMTPAYTSIHSAHGYIVFGMADRRVHKEGHDQHFIASPDMDTQRANACLIAASPDLLTALDWIIRLYDEGQPLGIEAITRARAARDKAEGRS